MSLAATSSLFLSLFLFFTIATGLSTAKLESSSGDPCPALSDGGRSCPVNCFRPDPVCGENGVTYWCGCLEAACAGVRVVKHGYCEVGNSGSGLVSGQAFLLIHIVWLIILGFSVLCGFL
ncbi:hypothetical protein HPP92_014607 [Vanilla planifolia]|uniref:Uncharacterized protein n=1 Tax=Vanilla planifolia TaxID=51239 RepID=A0A835QKB7_VANPL|nr:hypothetical protein HPP92_015067 [Vanilla planifolia]KAG0474921.1 hypothetical protein HPP92_014607 [Vanilla planifolia]